MRQLRTLLLALVVLAGASAREALAVEVRPYGAGSWAEVLARNEGRPVIVHVWGLTCPPCVAELPHWAELARQRPDVALVLINWDRHAYRADRVAEALRKAGLEGTGTWAFQDGFEAKLRFEIDPEWNGEMPYTQLRNADGTSTRFTGSADFARIGQWLDSQTAAR